MKTRLLAAVIGLAVLGTACVKTVSGDKTMGVPFVKDKIEARYERPTDQIVQAAKEVIQFNGTLVDEKTLFGQTNAVNNIAKVIEGRVNQRTVRVRVEQLDSRVSAVTVQTRTSAGGADIDLAAEIDKQIALKLVR